MKKTKLLLFPLLFTASLGFLAGCNKSAANGNYYSINKNKDGYYTVDSSFVLKDGKATYNDNSIHNIPNKNINKDKVTDDGKTYYKEHSQYYNEALKSEKDFSKEISQEREKYKEFRDNLDKTLSETSSSVQEDFLNKLSGTYTNQTTTDDSKSNLSVTLNKDKLSYTLQTTDNLLSQTVKNQISGTLTSDRSDKPGSVWVVDNDLEDMFGDLNIEQNISEAFKLDETVKPELDSISNQLDENHLAFKSDIQAKYNKILDDLSKTNTWDAYQKLTSKNRIAFVFNGDGSTINTSNSAESEISVKKK